MNPVQMEGCMEYKIDDFVRNSNRKLSTEPWAVHNNGHGNGKARGYNQFFGFCNVCGAGGEDNTSGPLLSEYINKF